MAVMVTYIPCDQVSRTETMVRGTKVLFVAIRNRLPSQCGNFFILTDLDIKCTIMLYFTFGTLPCSNLAILLKWLVAANRTLVSLAMVSVLLTWLVGEISSDYSHLSLIPYTAWVMCTNPHLPVMERYQLN